jgi:hypothetical protein
VDEAAAAGDTAALQAAVAWLGSLRGDGAGAAGPPQVPAGGDEVQSAVAAALAEAALAEGDDADALLLRDAEARPPPRRPAACAGVRGFRGGAAGGSHALLSQLADGPGRGDGRGVTWSRGWALCDRRAALLPWQGDLAVRVAAAEALVDEAAAAGDGAALRDALDTLARLTAGVQARRGASASHAGGGY